MKVKRRRFILSCQCIPVAGDPGHKARCRVLPLQDPARKSIAD